MGIGMSDFDRYRRCEEVGGMPDAGFGVRPEIETLECAGRPVRLVDPAEIWAAAAAQRVELLHGQPFPPPVRQVQLWVAGDVRDGRPVFLLDAVVRTGPGGADRPWPQSAVLGNDLLGALLARRVDAGDAWAARVVDGVGTAVAGVSRRLGLERPATGAGSGALDAEPDVGLDAVAQSEVSGSAVREDAGTGLRVTVTYRASGATNLVTLRAVVGRDVVSGRHLAAMFGFVLEAVRDLLGQGGAALPDGGYVLSRYPVGRSSVAGSAPVTLDRVGGLDAVVAQFRQIAISFRHPQVMARWGARRPQGILLYGPPGTGKTMLARALATEIGADFREIRTPEILDKWLGASERNIKRIFRDARRYRAPTVLLFDEFDSIISYAGAGGDAASQAVNAVAGIFKQEMNDLIEDNPNVMVVATTNFPDRVDESLIRSGRFDVKLAIPAPDAAGRAQILTKMIRQLIVEHEVPGFRMFADQLDVADLAAATSGMSGADIKEVLRRAQLDKAMQEARTGTPPAPISQDDLKQCIAELREAGARG
jgi:transitional endoplasmic reticulum ATPase